MGEIREEVWIPVGLGPNVIGKVISMTEHLREGQEALGPLKLRDPIVTVGRVIMYQAQGGNIWITFAGGKQVMKFENERSILEVQIYIENYKELEVPEPSEAERPDV